MGGSSGPFGAHGVPSLCWSWPWPACRGCCGWWLLVQAHSVRMALLPCAGRGPGRRGGAVADGGRWFRPTRCAWRSFLVVVLMVDGWWFRPTRCAWRSCLVVVLMVDGWWFRPTRCAWRSFLVVVLMVDGWWFRPTRCAWRSFLVLLGGPGRRGGAVVDGGRWFRPTRCAWRSFLVLLGGPG